MPAALLLVALAPGTSCRSTGAPAPSVTPSPRVVAIEHGDLRATLQPDLSLVVQHRRQGRWELVTAPGQKRPVFAVQLAPAGAGAPSRQVSFVLEHRTAQEQRIEDGFGRGRRLRAVARAPRSALELAISLTVYERYPRTLFVAALLHNRGAAPVHVARVQQTALVLRAEPRRWAFQGAALQWGHDYVFALPARYASRNDLSAAGPGETAGGGLPLHDFWTPRHGVALGHHSPLAHAVQMPVQHDERGTATWIEAPGRELAPGAALQSLPGFIHLHSGDFYAAVSTYRQLLVDQGHGPPRSPPTAYEAIWCSWGFEFDVHTAELLAVIPKLQQLGLRWLVIDDRWFTRYGDWQPRPDTFGADGAGLARVVRAAHAAGLRVKLWWIPLAVELDGGSYASRPLASAQLAREHPDWLIRDAQGRPVRGVRNLGILCPALPAVQRYLRQLTRRFVREWDIDGHKLDVVFAVPPCHDPRHEHAQPADASRAIATAQRIVYDTTRALKPTAVTEICPCGTPPHHAWLPYMNQAVTADPVGSAQVRRRVKLLKALLGPRFAVYGDHVELTQVRDGKEVGRDFAASIGTGAVIGTKFTWPEPQRELPDQGRLTMFLDADKQAEWARWIGIFNEQQLAAGEYLNHYDVGFDRPEAHVVRQGGRLHYAFYADAPAASYDGPLHFRGLPPGRHEVYDYVAQRAVGIVTREQPRLTVRFRDSLLVELRPHGGGHGSSR